MKYSKDKTIQLAEEIDKVECLEDINLLIRSEGCLDSMPIFVNGEVVLNMDCVEAKNAAKEKRNYNKSMDSAFIIVDEANGVTETLMVEFRFNYEKMKNLDKKELFGKVDGSKSALGNSETVVKDRYYYIFNTNLKEQARRRFRNMVPSMPEHFIATDIHELKDSYFT